MKMKEIECFNILPHVESREKPFDDIRGSLDKAKEEYKSMERIDFLEMYSVLKKLFFCYIDYIKHSTDHAIDMDEGDFLPGNSDELKSWLNKLNTSFPIKMNNK